MYSQLNYIALFTGPIKIGRSGQETAPCSCRYIKW